MEKITNAELIARLDAAAEKVNAEIDSTVYDDGNLHYERRVEIDGVTYLARCAFTPAQQAEAWDGQAVHAEELLPWDDAEWTWYKVDGEKTDNPGGEYYEGRGDELAAQRRQSDARRAYFHALGDYCQPLDLIAIKRVLAKLIDVETGK